MQAAVLRRTREKLEALEARLAALENGQKRAAELEAACDTRGRGSG